MARRSRQAFPELAPLPLACGPGPCRAPDARTVSRGAHRRSDPPTL